MYSVVVLIVSRPFTYKTLLRASQKGFQRFRFHTVADGGKMPHAARCLASFIGSFRGLAQCSHPNLLTLAQHTPAFELTLTYIH